LEAYPLPQILCSPLEQVVLDSKTYTDEKAEKFLSALIQPPSPIAIQKAVNYLMDFGVFDNEENLTALGKRLVLFPTHPKISKALVYSTIFK
jgi:ATP-dependent RNA helicase DHX36